MDQYHHVHVQVRQQMCRVHIRLLLVWPEHKACRICVCVCVCVCGEEDGAGQKLNWEITTRVLQTYLFNLPQVIAIMLSQNNYMTHLALNYYYYNKTCNQPQIRYGSLGLLMLYRTTQPFLVFIVCWSQESWSSWEGG